MFGNKEPATEDVLLSYDYASGISCSEDEEQAADLDEMEANRELSYSYDSLAMYFHTLAKRSRSDW